MQTRATSKNKTNNTTQNPVNQDRSTSKNTTNNSSSDDATETGNGDEDLLQNFAKMSTDDDYPTITLDLENPENTWVLHHFYPYVIEGRLQDTEKKTVLKRAGKLPQSE